VETSGICIGSKGRNAKIVNLKTGLKRKKAKEKKKKTGFVFKEREKYTYF
jgi:hypothetical protein